MSNNLSEVANFEGEGEENSYFERNLNLDYYFRIGVSIYQTAFDTLTISVGTEFSLNLWGLSQEEMWYLMSMQYLSTYDDTRWNEDRKRLVEFERQNKIICLLKDFRLIISRENFLNQFYGGDLKREEENLFRVGRIDDSKNSTGFGPRFNFGLNMDEINQNFWQNTNQRKSKAVIVIAGPSIFIWQMVLDLYQMGFRKFVVPKSSIIDSFDVQNSEGIPGGFYGRKFSEAIKQFLPNIRVENSIKRRPDFLIFAEVNWLIKFPPWNFIKHRIPFCFLLIHHKSFTLSKVYHKGNFFEFEKFLKERKTQNLMELQPNYRLFGEEIYKYPNIKNVTTQTKKIAEVVNDFFSLDSTKSSKTSQKEKELI